jgi:hypothetical protein
MKHIDVELELRKKLGITIHKNMSIPEILGQWQKVPQPIQAAYPEITQSIAKLQTAYSLYLTGKALKETLHEAYIIQKEVLEDGSSFLYAPSLPIAKLSDKGQELILQGEAAALNYAVDFAYTKLVESLTK